MLYVGLPPSGSWQDLKDHMREAGDVCFADAFKDGSGVVEFLRYEDMKYAIKKLDDSRFRSHEVRPYLNYCCFRGLLVSRKLQMFVYDKICMLWSVDKGVVRLHCYLY